MQSQQEQDYTKKLDAGLWRRLIGYMKPYHRHLIAIMATMAVSALYSHFYRILKYEALLQADPRPSPDRKAKVLGVNPFFFKEYDAAVANYPMRRAMAVISLLNDYDYKGKGGETGEAGPGELLVEMVAKILTI